MGNEVCEFWCELGMNFDEIVTIWNEFVMINEKSRGGGGGGLAEMRGNNHVRQKRNDIYLLRKCDLVPKSRSHLRLGTTVEEPGTPSFGPLARECRERPGPNILIDIQKLYVNECQRVFEDTRRVKPNE